MDDHDFDFWREHPDPSDAEIRDLCEAWLRYQRDAWDARAAVDGHPCWWAVQAAMSTDDLNRLWRIVRGLCKYARPDDPAIGMIGPAPIEEMLFMDAGRAMDLIEPAADEDPVLVEALTSVWADEPTRSRIDALLAQHGRGSQ
jgi:hypothetical protein